MSSPLPHRAVATQPGSAHGKPRRRAGKKSSANILFPCHVSELPHPYDTQRPRNRILFDYCLPQVYTSSTTRVTISIVHDSQDVVDTIGPLSIAELKTEANFSLHGPESVSRYKSFVLWRDNTNPRLLVLSMVKKIPDGDVNKRCYRLVVQVQKDSRSQEYSPTVVYYDSSTLKPSMQGRFAMASKTPKEASEKLKRLAAAAGTGQAAAVARTGHPGQKRVPSGDTFATGARKRSRKQPEPHKMAGLVLPATDAAAELVKLLTGQIKTTDIPDGPTTGVNTPDTPSAMFGSWSVSLAERGHAVAPHMLSSVASGPWQQPQLDQHQHQFLSSPQTQAQPPHFLQQEPTSSDVSKRQVPHGLGQSASACPPASTVQLKTDPDGRVTIGL